jgi:hypothetical protein
VNEPQIKLTEMPCLGIPVTRGAVPRFAWAIVLHHTLTFLILLHPLRHEEHSMETCRDGIVAGPPHALSSQLWALWSCGGYHSRYPTSYLEDASVERKSEAM